MMPINAVDYGETVDMKKLSLQEHIALDKSKKKLGSCNQPPSTGITTVQILWSLNQKWCT